MIDSEGYGMFAGLNLIRQTTLPDHMAGAEPTSLLDRQQSVIKAYPES